MAKKKKNLSKGKKSLKKKTGSFRLNSSVKKGVILFILLALSGMAFLYYSKDVKRIKRENVIQSIPRGFPSFGIDVSHHQGEIDWEKLFVDEHYDTIVHFVYCKATEGTDHIDTRWKENRSILQKLKIAHGAYHFFSSDSDPEAQADNFLGQWKKEDLDLPPVLDVETEGSSDKDLIAKMKIWLNNVELKTGMRPVIYTSLNFFETKFTNEFKNYKFWIAAYSRRPACLEDSRIIHWQYSESGKLPGIEENVDFNVSKIVLR